MKDYYVTVQGYFFVAAHDGDEAYEKALDFIDENQDGIELEILDVKKQNWDADEI